MNDKIKEILEQCDGVVKREIPLLILAPEYTQLLLDYITNLQEEKERYKAAYENVMIANKMLDEKYKDYKTRIDKVIEYINKHKELLHHSFDEPDCDYWLTTNPEDLLNILQGKSDE